MLRLYAKQIRPLIRLQDEGPLVVPPAFAESRDSASNAVTGFTRPHLIGGDGPILLRPKSGNHRFACRFAPASSSLKGYATIMSLLSLGYEVGEIIPGREIVSRTLLVYFALMVGKMAPDEQSKHDQRA